MKVFETGQIREIDDYTTRQEPISSVDLMERAALGCVRWIERNIDRNTPLYIFAGPGNNGGDGWAIARLLSDLMYINICFYQLQINRIISPDSEINRTRLFGQGKVPVYEIKSSADFPVCIDNSVIIDALFGSGLTRPLEGMPAALIDHLNNSGCRIISIDIPSGLMGEDNSGNPEPGIIRASDTLTFQFPKRSFFYAENEKFIGSWHIIPIGLHPGILSEKQSNFHYTTMDDLSGKIVKRKRFSHKGTNGHALLIAGSYGMAGAAILAARACIRSGTGLLTTHVPRSVYPIVQGAVPESIFSIDHSEEFFLQCPVPDKYSAVAAGPGIGVRPQTKEALETLIKSTLCPLVLDADALNILAAHPELLSVLPHNTILTPHPGEFERLTSRTGSGFKRNEEQIGFSKKYKLIVVLKGAFTSITMPDGRCYFNSTGNPGMATAGSGDVLTGIILSLLAQGYSPGDAAVTGTFLHGLAGDMAAEDLSQQGLIASDIIKYIGKAFKKIMDHGKSPQ
jgi:NAD(P)H-hydrate epimerase